MNISSHSPPDRMAAWEGRLKPMTLLGEMKPMNPNILQYFTSDGTTIITVLFPVFFIDIEIKINFPAMENGNILDYIL